MSDELDLVILKHIITNKNNALEFINGCDTNLFSPEVWNFSKIVVNYIKSYRNVPTLRVIEEKLAKSKNNAKLIDTVRKIWGQLDKVEINEKEYKFDLEKIKNRFAEKEITRLQETLLKQDNGSIDVQKTLSEMQKAIQTIRGIEVAKTHERKTLRNAIPSFTERFNAKRANPNVDAGLMTGYSGFDNATNGCKPADFVLIAGESGFGKSLLLMNMSVQVWLQGNNIHDLSSFKEGKNVVFFSLEMPYEDCFNRLLSRLANVPSNKLDNPAKHKMEPEEFQRVKEALKFIKEYPYEFEIVDISEASANDLDLVLNDIQYKIDAIFVDYLGIMRTNEKNDESDWIKQGIISYELRAIARKRFIPMFSAVQLNRKSGGKTSESNIGLNRLARSATIATHATQVLQIENRANEECMPQMPVHIIKNRRGKKGKFNLIKDLACATLVDEVVEKSAESEEKFSDYNPGDIDDISAKIELLDI